MPDHLLPGEAAQSCAEKKFRTARFITAGPHHGCPTYFVIGVAEQTASRVLGQQRPLVAGGTAKVRVLVVGEPCDQVRGCVAAVGRTPADLRFRIGEQALLHGQRQRLHGDAEPVGSVGQSAADTWIGIVQEPSALFRRHSGV
ncbi:hypothetical protein [Streptomyces prunicolor]|uniref:hypothetical protein n=1 Tax=Streptomyces prunicolor TaxID=67348 RepID=UPI001FE0904B|nr:hypothetical protein [Streptomyces prunicolor]